MKKPTKQSRSPADLDLRIPLTVRRKQLVEQAATLAKSDVTAWLRPIILQAAQEVITAQELRKATPSNRELRKLARRSPPAREWFEQDEEKPF
jgi:uncharacterized protein (DUF1778 family)